MKTKKLSVIFDRILVDVKDNPYEPESKIITTGVESTKPYYYFGVIDAVGSEVKFVEEGTEIFFSTHAGYPVKVGSAVRQVIRESDILAIVKDEEATK